MLPYPNVDVTHHHLPFITMFSFLFMCPFVVVVVVVVVALPTFLHTLTNPSWSPPQPLSICTLTMLLVVYVACFVDSPPQKNGKKPIDVAKSEVSGDFLTFISYDD